MTTRGGRSEVVEAEGHLVDSQFLTLIFNKVIERGGRFDVLEFKLGRTNEDFSHLKLKVTASDDQTLRHLLEDLIPLGCHSTPQGDAALTPAESDGVAPDGFYSTTNHQTQVRFAGQWREVDRQRMDAVIVIEDGRATCRKLRDVTRGDLIVCGVDGIRVSPEFQERDRLGFAFMTNDVSTERRVEVSAAKVVAMMRHVKSSGGRIGFVAGPVVVHSGGAGYFSELIRRGYVDVLLAGNALAVHDVERALFGTSLGVDLEDGVAVAEGHQNHMRAINTVRRAGGLRPAVAQGVLRSGIMHDLIVHDVPYVLAGSIRDDGPLPDTFMDLVAAQDEYAAALTDCLHGHHALDHAPQHRRRQHAAVTRAGRVRRHQSRGRHETRRSRLVPNGWYRHGRRTVSSSAVNAARSGRRGRACIGDSAPHDRDRPMMARESAAAIGDRRIPCVVQKYGGTSVGTPERICAIADRVARERDDATGLVVILSAMGKTTDQLVDLAHMVAKHPRGREMDHLLATGEQVSVSLLALALQDRGVPAISLTAAQCGIRTDDVFNLARIQSIDTDRIVSELNHGRVVIITGFQGITDTLEVTTLGRGGSDISGAAVAVALGASACEIYTDVDGVFTADPGIVPDARMWAEISYEEAIELASSRRQGPAPTRRGSVYGLWHSDSRAVELQAWRGNVDPGEERDGDGTSGGRGRQ